MESVRNLNRLGSGFSRGSSIIGSTVAADHLHFGVCSQPLGKGRGFPIGKQVYDFVLLKVYEYGTVPTPLLPTPVVHPKNANFWGIRQRQSHKMTQKRRRGNLDTHFGGQSGSRFSPCDQTNSLQRADQAMSL